MEPHLHAMLGTLSVHAQLGLVVVFAAALLESVAVIGIFFPGSTLVVAGMSDMSPARFCSVNVLSATAWAGAHLVPGALFGASIQLAGAVSARLLVLLLLLVGSGWLIWRAVRLAHGRLVPILVRARDRFVEWARSGSHLQHRVTLALFDPERSESPALLVAAVVLVASAWLFLGVLEDVLSRESLVQFDQAVFRALQSLRTAWVDGLMVAITEVGSVRVAVPVIGAVGLLLVVKRCWRTLAYWFAAVGFAQVLVWVLKVAVGRTRPSPVYTGIEQYSFPSGHATSAIVLYGFLAFLLARGRGAVFKVVVSAVVAGLILMIAFSRLYLGAHWFSDVLAGLSAGLAWVALLAIAYTHHVRAHNLRTPALALTSLGVLLLASAIQIGTHHAIDVARYRAPPSATPTLVDHWAEMGWRSLPAFRTDLGGDSEEPMALQWAGLKADLLSVLGKASWQPPPPWSPRAVLLWLLPHPPIEQLPVLSKLNRDEPQALVLTRVADPQSRLVLRLWRTDHEVLPPSAEHPRPLWLGTVTLERLRHPAGLFTITQTDPNVAAALGKIVQDLADPSLAVVRRDRLEGSVLLAW